MAPRTGRVGATVSAEGWAEAESLLAKLPLLIRGTELGKSMKAGARVTVKRAKQLVPPPGYPGDKTKKKPELTPLRDTIDHILRNYQGGYVLGIIIGPVYKPKGGGNHGHLVELGHRIAAPKTGSLPLLADSDKKTPGKSKYGRGTGVHMGDVEPHPFMKPAWEDTKGQFEPKILASLRKSIVKHGG